MATFISPMIVNVGYRSTNFWVVSAGRSRILVDLGWPGRVAALLANLDRMGVPLGELRYGLATHYHIDHAGAAQDLKQRGVPLLVMEEQIAAIPKMKQWTKPADNYTEITTHDNVIISTSESRPLLADIGIAGEIVHTPGHSDDSVSLVLDIGCAFTGDLTMETMVAGEDPAVVARSWQMLRDRGGRRSTPATALRGIYNRVTSDQRPAMSDKRQATSDKRLETSDKRLDLTTPGNPCNPSGSS